MGDCGWPLGDGWHIVATGQVDNRNDLSCALGHSGQLPDDAHLIGQAFSKWGPDVVDHLKGDWAFVAWHAPSRQLHLFRDHCGNSALFYAWLGDAIAFASRLTTLRRMVPCRALALNEIELVRPLVAWPPLKGGQTVFRGIMCLPPGHSATATARGVSVRCYWDLKRIPPSTDSADDCLRQFGVLFRQAVDRRLPQSGGVATTLSGGLDSTSVTVQASLALATQGRSLTALTAVPTADFLTSRGAGSLGDEGPLARAAIHGLGNVRHLFVAAEGLSPVMAVRRMLDIQGRPGLVAVNAYWILALLSRARGEGAQTVLTGQMGNAVWSWPGGARRTRLGRIRRAISGLAWRASPLLEVAVRRWQQGIPERFSLRDLRTPWRPYAAIRDDYAESVSLIDHMTEQGHDPWHRPSETSGREARLRLLRPGAQQVGALWSQLAEEFGIAIRDPSLDRDLVAASWALPDDAWRGPQSRWVIRHVMRGQLPDEVRLHAGGHVQAIDLRERLRRHVRDVHDALDEIAASRSASDRIDVARCRAIAASLTTSPGPTLLQAKMVLMVGLSVGLFLAGLDGCGRREAASQ